MGLARVYKIRDLLVLEVLQFFSLLLTVLELNYRLDVLAVLRLLDFLFKLLVQLLELYLLQVLFPNACLLLSMLLHDSLCYLFALLRAEVRLGVEVLGIVIVHLLHLLPLLHLHLDVLLVLEILQPPQLLLYLECLLLGGYLILKLLPLHFLLHSQVLQLVVHSLFGVRLRQLVVVVVFITLCLVVVVNRVGTLRAKESRDFLVIVRVHFLYSGI
jgi:hypothetical protein